MEVGCNTGRCQGHLRAHEGSEKGKDVEQSTESVPGLSDMDTMPRSAYRIAAWRATMTFPYVPRPPEEPALALTHSARDRYIRSKEKGKALTSLLMKYSISG